MIDTYARIGIVVRFITALSLLYVIVEQVRLLQVKSDVQRYKYLLTSLTLIMFVNAVFTVIANLFRQSDGNLIEWMRHFSTILNAMASLAAATILVLIYKKDN